MSTAIPLTAGVPVPGPELTHAARLGALDDLSTAGWPSRRREAWRYTDLEPLAKERFELVPPALHGDEIANARRLMDDGTFGEPEQRIVLIDGMHVPELGAGGGIDVVDVVTRWDEFVTEFVKPLRAGDYPLAALNTAYARRGLWLRIPRRTTPATVPLHIVVVGSGRAGVAAQPRIVIDAEAGAEATLVQHFVDCGNSANAWSNSVTQLRQAEGSRVTLYRLQRHSPGIVHTSLLAAELAEGAELTCGYFDLGARLARNDISIALNRSGARAELFGLLLAGAAQHIDDHTLIRHAAGSTVSRENFRAIIGERGRGVFNGKVIVDPDCQRIDAAQRNDNLLLGEHAEIDTKPELEIYANDVKCSHGTTVGELDEEQLFYLRARGLDLPTARGMLTTAFAASIVEKIADPELRDRVLELVTARLGTLTES